MENKLYKYELCIKPNNKKTAEIIEYDLIANTKEQFCFKRPVNGIDIYYVLDKITFDHKSNIKKAHYFTGDKFIGIEPCFRAWLYSTKKSKANEAKVIELLKKEIQEKLGLIQGFIDIDYEKIEFKEV